MPELITRFYEFTGWSEVLIFTEAEMAIAMGISREELRRVIEQGGNHIGCHAHPLSNPEREYQFTRQIFEDNILVWQCEQGGGHTWELHHYYDKAQNKAVWRCKHCPAERYD